MKYKKGDNIEFHPTSWNLGKKNGVISGVCFSHYHIIGGGFVDKTNVIGLYEEKKENHYLTMEDIAEKFGIKDVESIKIVKILDCNK